MGICISNASKHDCCRLDFAGKTDLEQARADMIVDCLEDATKPLLIFHFEADADKKVNKSYKCLFLAISAIAHTRTCVHIQACTHIDARTHVCIHVGMHTPTHTHTYTYTYTYTHTYTCTNVMHAICLS